MGTPKGADSVLLPKTALYNDGKLTYIWIVEKTRGAWGNEYSVKKKYITAYFDENDNLVFYGKLESPVVIDVNTQIYDGAVVRFR
jgi:hypothetical protein